MSSNYCISELGVFYLSLYYNFIMQILLSLFYYFYFSVVGVYVIFVPKVLADVGYSAIEIGLILGASPLVRFILPFLFMRGLQLNSKIFNFALVVMSLSAVSFYFSVYDFYKLLFSNIFLGVGLSLILPYIEFISLQVIGKERYGKIRLFGSIGFILISLILVNFLSESTEALKALLLLTLITAVVAFIIVRFRDKERVVEKKVQKNDINLLKDYKLWGGLILMQMSFGSFYNFFTIYSTDNGIKLDMTIYLWSFGVVFEIVMFFFQAKLLRKNLLAVLKFTTFITAIRWLLVFSFADSLGVLFFTQSLHALSFALFHSASISYLHFLYKNKTLAQQFFSGITYGLGGLSGAIIAGYIYEWYPEYLFLSSSIMAFGAFFFLSLWEREVKER